MLKLKFILFLSISFAFIACSANEQRLKDGKDNFVFQDSLVNPDIALEVYTYKPTNYNANSEILFVMHGNRRNPDVYRDQWVEFAEENNALLICPGFDIKNFPLDQDYNMGHMFHMNLEDSLLRINPKNIWSYSFIEPIFDYVRKMEKNKNEEYLIYGHSAGSQFVHRFLMFIPDARIKRAVAANAGWYTFPDLDIVFPYGLKETTADLEYIKKAFSKEMTILLGTDDTSRTSKSLRRKPEAMLQGSNRFERGQSFYNFSKELAEKNNFDFMWRLEFVENVGHSNKRMAAPATKILFK